MTDLSAVQQFFASTFGRALPMSTVGQSATHNRLGWDHRNAVDVGVHPDSKEGQALIGFLQSSNIPFLAFRSRHSGSRYRTSYSHRQSVTSPGIDSSPRPPT
jgi:hypothetical protein